MKRQGTLLILASVLMLITCGAYRTNKLTVASSPEPAMVPADHPLLLQRSTGSSITFKDVFARCVAGLLGRVTANKANSSAADGSVATADQGGARSANRADGSADPDPYRLRARAQFRTPSLAGGPDDRR
jgi:hypothetical protein